MDTLQETPSGGICLLVHLFDRVGKDSTSTRFEKDAAFWNAIRNIQKWVERRNEALHATAAVLHSDTSPKDFITILRSHRKGCR